MANNSCANPLVELRGEARPGSGVAYLSPHDIWASSVRAAASVAHGVVGLSNQELPKQ
jgi:hypothetical protein